MRMQRGGYLSVYSTKHSSKWGWSWVQQEPAYTAWHVFKSLQVQSLIDKPQVGNGKMVIFCMWRNERDRWLFLEAGIIILKKASNTKTQS